MQPQNINSSAPELLSELLIIIMRNDCLSFWKKLRDPVKFFFGLSESDCNDLQMVLHFTVSTRSARLGGVISDKGLNFFFSSFPS